MPCPTPPRRECPTPPGSLSGLQAVEYSYDRQAETDTTTDANGTTHTFTYNGLGRESTDTVTVPDGNPANIDLTVTELAFGYKACGRLQYVTSENAEGDIVNQLFFAYDTNGNLDDEYEEYGGAVDTSTSMYVAYGYDDSTGTGYDGALGTSVTIAMAGFRPATLQYPTTGTDSSRVITDSYGTSGSMDDQINQLDAILDGSGMADDATTGDTLDTIGTLGDGTIVSEQYVAPQVGYNLLGTTGTSPNLDQFNRIQNLIWAGYGTNASAGTLAGNEYQRNLQGDVSVNVNAKDAAFSEMYANDVADQLTNLTRGTISEGSIASPTYEETFLPDGNGNIAGYTQSVGGTTEVDQTRTANSTNEISSVTNATGETAWAAPEYDAAGNETQTPSPLDPTQALAIQVNGWGQVTHVTGTGVDISYQYDGLGDMTVRTDNLAAAGTAATTFFYYAGQQMIESVQQTPASPGDGATTVTNQYVYSPRYVNSPILDTQTTSTYSVGSSSWSSSSSTYYFLTDAKGCSKCTTHLKVYWNALCLSVLSSAHSQQLAPWFW
jgi:YD repeat-containing protein